MMVLRFKVCLESYSYLILSKFSVLVLLLSFQLIVYGQFLLKTLKINLSQTMFLQIAQCIQYIEDIQFLLESLLIFTILN